MMRAKPDAPQSATRRPSRVLASPALIEGCTHLNAPLVAPLLVATLREQSRTRLRSAQRCAKLRRSTHNTVTNTKFGNRRIQHYKCPHTYTTIGSIHHRFDGGGSYPTGAGSTYRPPRSRGDVISACNTKTDTRIAANPAAEGRVPSMAYEYRTHVPRKLSAKRIPSHVRLD